MANLLDYRPPGLEGLLGYLKEYPGRVKDEFMEGASQLKPGINQILPAIQMRYSWATPAVKDLATQGGNLLASGLNRIGQGQHEAMQELAQQLGLPESGLLADRQEITGEQLATPLLLAASLPRGNLFKRMKAPDPEGALRRKLGRKEEVGATQERKVLEKDGEKMVVGDITFNDWKERVSSLPSAVVQDYRQWYGTALAQFNKVFGKSRGEKYMLGWLLGNQNESPAGAMRNLLRAEDKTLNIPQSYTAGLGEQKILQALGQGDIESGAGPKLMDFVDSAYERNLRTFMGDRPEGGGPAVMDVHSTRDMGYVDDTFKKWLHQKFGDQADDITVDVKGGVLDTQYERGSEKMNRFAQEANAEGFLGGDWTPHEIQAVGWKYMGDKVGGGVQTIPEALQSNIRRLSTELTFAHGSPLDQKYGEIWRNMPYKDQAFLTDYVFRNTLPDLMADVGVRGDANLAGGKYQDDPWVPSIQLDALASAERAADMADMIGLTYQQDMVIRGRPLKSGTTLSLEVVLDGNPNMRQAMKFLESLKSELGAAGTGGYYTPETNTMTLFLENQPRVTSTGKISNVIESTAALNARISGDLDRAIDATRDLVKLGIKDRVLFNSEANWHGEFDHWKQGGSGEPFKSALRERQRSDLLAGLDNYNQGVGQATDTGIQILESGQAKNFRRRPIRGPSLLTLHQQTAQPGGFLMPRPR